MAAPLRRRPLGLFLAVSADRRLRPGREREPTPIASGKAQIATISSARRLRRRGHGGGPGVLHRGPLGLPRAVAPLVHPFVPGRRCSGLPSPEPCGPCPLGLPPAPTPARRGRPWPRSSRPWGSSSSFAGGRGLPQLLFGRTRGPAPPARRSSGPAMRFPPPLVPPSSARPRGPGCSERGRLRGAAARPHGPACANLGASGRAPARFPGPAPGGGRRPGP